MPTLSEKLFEQYCTGRGIRWRRIVEGVTQKPDYELFMPRRKVIVEVKETTPNADERRAAAELKQNRFAVTSLTPGERIRSFINKAAPQLKALTRRRFPGVLVVFDDGLVARHNDPYQIRVAMYGFDQIVFAVPQDMKVSPYAVGAKSGGRRKMTEAHNTSVSAIASLYCRSKDQIDLVLYHNRFAAVPLDPQLFGRYGIRQFQLGNAMPGEIPQWVEYHDCAPAVVRADAQ